MAWALFAALLGACSPDASTKPEAVAAQPAPLPEEVLSQGNAIYDQVCATCHFDGHGSPTAPSLADSALVKNSPGEMITQVLKGKQGTFKNNVGLEVNGIMPPQSGLSDEDVAAVVTFVRHQFGKVDELTTPAEVAAKR